MRDAAPAAGRTLGRPVAALLPGNQGAGARPDRCFAGSLEIINFVARLLIWSLLMLVALENLGVNITALLAGLGVGGVAVALALQNVLGDLFASLSIALDKPFMVGDRLVIDAFSGTVERIGIKTHPAAQRHRRADHPVECGHSEEPGAQFRPRARSSARWPRIRVRLHTPADKLQAIPKLLERIVREQPNARFERCHLTDARRLRPAVRTVLFRAAAAAESPARSAAGGQFPHHRGIPPAGRRVRLSDAACGRRSGTVIDVHVVLFEPEIPPNTGNVDPAVREHRRDAAPGQAAGVSAGRSEPQRSGLDYHDLAEVRVHADLDACVARSPVRACWRWKRARASATPDFGYRAGDALLFGPETRGLPARARADRRENSLYIPMRPAAETQLSNAAALVSTRPGASSASRCGRRRERRGVSAPSFSSSAARR